MPLAQIQAIPKTPGEIAGWSFAHAANHRDIIRRLIETGKSSANTLMTYYLDNFSPDAIATTSWLYQHAVTHQQMDLALGIQPYNLNTLDWQDPDSVANWFDEHSVEHQQASQILGLG